MLRDLILRFAVTLRRFVQAYLASKTLTLQSEEICFCYFLSADFCPNVILSAYVCDHPRQDLIILPRAWEVFCQKICFSFNKSSIKYSGVYDINTQKFKVYKYKLITQFQTL